MTRTNNREEKLLRHVAMVAKFMDVNKPWSCKYGRKTKKLTRVFPVHDCTSETER